MEKRGMPTMSTFKTRILISLCLAIIAIISLSYVAAATPKPGHQTGGAPGDHFSVVPPDDVFGNQPDVDRPSIPAPNNTLDAQLRAYGFPNKAQLFFGLDACPNYPELAFDNFFAPSGTMTEPLGPEFPALNPELGMLSGPLLGYDNGQVSLLANPYGTFTPFVGPCTGLDGYSGYWSP
jgi:hypothetical protein